MRLKKIMLLLFVFTFSAVLAFGQDCGDVNADGTTGIIDALLVSQCYVGLGSCPADISDVNCDGAIDILDALLIAQFYVGLIDTLNCCGIPTLTPSPSPIPTDLFHAYFQKNVMIAVNHECNLACDDLNENLRTELPGAWEDISDYIEGIKEYIADSDTKKDAIDAAASFIETNWNDIRSKIETEIDNAFPLSDDQNCHYIRFEQDNYCTTYVFLDVKDKFGREEFAFYVLVLALQLRAQDLKPTQDPDDLQQSYIDQISPDWLTTAHNMIEGGPGGAAVECADTNTLINKSAYQFFIQDGDSIIPASNFLDGKVGTSTSRSEVYVYILDTMPFIYDYGYDSNSTFGPKPSDIESKINGMEDSNHPANLLLGNLPGYTENDFFKRNDSFQICDSCYPNQQDLCCDICEADILEIHDQDYNTSIPDHGIFIAGLIQSIAPDATIEILQALNSSGVGSMQTFLCPLNYIHRNMAGKKIIINCSFGLKCSFQNSETVYEAIVADPWAVNLTVVKSLETLMYMFRDTTVFASTGNNNGAESTYPAALDLEHVIGVGSLGIDDGSDPPKYKRASYSNTTKRTMWDPATGQTIVTNGFYAPGGMLINPTASREARVTSVEKGLLGLYLGDGTIDPPIYAYWCGTSFAASIVAGVFANLYRQFDRGAVIGILQNLEGNLGADNPMEETNSDPVRNPDFYMEDIIAVPIIQRHMYNNR